MSVVSLGHTTAAGSANNIVGTMNAAAPSNSRVVGVCGWFNNTVVINAASGGGLTWGIDGQKKSGSVNSGVVSAPCTLGIAASAVTVTFNGTGASGRILILFYLTGVDLTTALDGTPGTSLGSSTAWSGGAITPTVAGGTTIGCAYRDAGADTTSTPATNYTEIDDIGAGTGDNATAVYREGAPTPNTPSGTWAATGDWAGVSINYKSSGGSSASRTASDSFTISDANTRTMATSRTTSDSFTASDSASRATSASRTASDSFSVSDAVRVGVARTASDSFTVSDSVSRVDALARTISDSFSISDAAPRTTSLGRSVADSFSASDSVSRGTASRSRSIVDSFTLADAVTRVVSASRTTRAWAVASGLWLPMQMGQRGDVISFSDAASGTRGQGRTTSDSFAASDSVSRVSSDSRTTSDSFTVSDAVARSATSRSRTTSDSFSFSNVVDVSSSGATTRSTADSFTVSDAVVRSPSPSSRATGDSWTIADVASGSASSGSLSRTASEAFSFTDSVTRSTSLARSTSSSFTVGDSTGPSLNSRTASNSFSISDVATLARRRRPKTRVVALPPVGRISSGEIVSRPAI